MRSSDIPWLRVLVEGVVIVGSILLAFALDAWWDDRNRRDELGSRLEVVADELRSARDALERSLDVHDTTADLVRRVASALEAVPTGATVTVSDSVVAPLLPQTTADVTTGSLDAFLADGGLDLIEDADVRRGLRDWPTQIEDLQDDEIFLRNFAAADLVAHLRSGFDVANAELWSVPLLRSMFGAGPPVDPEALGSVTLRREQRLMNLLAARESGERALRTGLVEMLEQADRLVAALEELE